MGVKLASARLKRLRIDVTKVQRRFRELKAFRVQRLRTFNTQFIAQYLGLVNMRKVAEELFRTRGYLLMVQTKLQAKIGQSQQRFCRFTVL